MADTTTQPTYEGRTAEEWHAMATAARQRSAESFARSDTDGFLSQWASDSIASQYDLCAEVAERNGLWDFEAVVTLDGEEAPARFVNTRYGRKVAVFASIADRDTYGAPVLAWVTPTDRALAKHGLRLGTEEAPAKVVLHGNGTGLSGALTVRPIVVRDK